LVAVDTSTLIAFLANNAGEDIDLLDQALDHRAVMLPPVVLSEVLSDPKLKASLRQLFLKLPLLPISADYWQRAGASRARVIAKGFKARLADTLIAQSCIDHRVPLITRDSDFRHFVKVCGLELARF